MIAKYLIWVMLCWGSDCKCERITYGVTDKALYLKSDRGELVLVKLKTIEEKRYTLMAQDTSLYYVMGDYRNGLVVFINHLNQSKKIDYSVVITTEKSCIQEQLKINE